MDIGGIESAFSRQRCLHCDTRAPVWGIGREGGMSLPFRQGVNWIMWMKFTELGIAIGISTNEDNGYWMKF